MTFRGQNYLSGAIRRIGYDVGALSQKAQLANQRAQLQVVGSRLRQSKLVAETELNSVQQGARALSLQRARLNLDDTQTAKLNKLHAIEKARYQNLTNQAAVQREIGKLTTAQAAGITAIGPGLKNKAPVTVNESLAIQQRRMKELEMEAGNLEEAYRRQNQVIANAPLALQQQAARESALAQRGAQLNDVIQTRTRAIEQNTIAQARNNFEATKIEPVQAWQQRAAAIEHTTRVMQMFGLIATATIGYAAQASAKFQQLFTLAATQARPPGAPATVTANIAREIQKRVMGMMQQFPASAEDMSQSFYEIFSGTNIQQVDKATEAVMAFNKMAVAGGADLKTMTDAGISMWNNFGGLHGEFKNMTQAANAFFATVRYGRMNAQQWAQAMPMVVGIAKEAGLTYKDVSGAMAQLTRQTGARYTSRDAMGLARLIQLLARSDVQAGLAAKGIQVWNKETQRMNPLVQIIGQIHDKLHLTNKEALNFFKNISAAGSGKSGTQGTIQAIRAFAFLTGNMEAYRTQQKNVTKDTNEMIRSFEAMSKTPGIGWARFVNQLKVLIYMIGTQAIPAFMEMGRPIQRLIKWFLGLSDSTKRLIANIAAFGSVGMLAVGVFGGIAASIARLVLQMVVLSRTRALSNFVMQMQLAQTEAQQFVAAQNAFSGSLFIPVGATTVPVTKAAQVAETEAAAAATTRLRTSQAGFARTSAAMSLGLTALVAGLVMYHKQIGQVTSGMGGWQQVMLVLGATLVAFLPKITKLMTAGTALSRVMKFTGLAALVAIFASTAAGSDMLRKSLDGLFSGWGGWIAVIILMTAAAVKLRNAWIALQVTSKLSALWTGISAGASTAAKAIVALTTSVKAYAAAQMIAARGQTITAIPVGGTGAFRVRGAGGRFVGTASAEVAQAAAAGTGVRAATTGVAAGVTGLGAALGAFLPTLAVGGALLGGLYLWKRHLDSVHDAQERVRRTQEYIDQYLSGGKTLNAVRQYVGTLEQQIQAQINYNAALKRYKIDLAEGVKGDQLKQDLLDLARYERELDNATKRSMTGRKLWNQQLAKNDDLHKFVQRYQTGVNRIKKLIAFGKGTQMTLQEVKEYGTNPLITQISGLYGIESWSEADKILKNYEGYLTRAERNLAKAHRNFIFAWENQLKEFGRLRVIPQISGRPLEQVAQLITKLPKAPTLPQIKLMVRAAVALDPSVPRDIPKQYRGELNRIWRMIYATHIPLNQRQLNFLLKVVLGIDPSSKIGKQVKNLWTQIIAQIQTSFSSLGAGLPTATGGGLFPFEVPKPPKQAIKPEITPKQKAAAEHARQTAGIRQAQQMQATINRIISLHERALHTNSLKDWKAYYNALEAAQKKWTGTTGQAFQAMLDAQESAMQDSVKNAQNASQKMQISFEDAMSGVKQMYDNFLQQEQSNFGTLFQGPWMTSPMFQTETQYGHLATPYDLSKDMRQQITQYKNFNKMLDQLRKRGAPSELINQLRTLGPQATEQVKALTRMSEPEIKRYFQMFRNAQNLIHKQAMADLNKQLDDYRKYGRNIALQIVAGLKDENQALEKQLTAMIKRIFGNVPTQAEIDKKQQNEQKKQTGGGGRTRTTHHIPVVGTPPHAVTGRMSGGPVKERLPFLVGERGQELFVPKESGRIITNIQTKRLLSQLDHLNRTAPVLPLDEVARQHGGRVIKHHRYRVGEKGPEVVIPDFGHGHARRNRANDLAARAQFAAERAGPSYIRRERQKALRHPVHTGVPTPAMRSVPKGYHPRSSGGFGHWIGSKFHLAVRDVKSMPRATLQMGQAAAHDAARTGYYISRGLHIRPSEYERRAHRTPWQLPVVARGMEQSFIESLRHPLRDPFMTAMWLSPLGKFGRFGRLQEFGRIADRGVARGLERHYVMHGTNLAAGRSIERMGIIRANQRTGLAFVGSFPAANKFIPRGERGAMAFVRRGEIWDTERGIHYGAHRGNLPVLGVAQSVTREMSASRIYARYLRGRVGEHIPRLHPASPEVRRIMQYIANETGAVDLAKLYGPHTPRELKTFDKEFQLYKNAAGRIQYRYGKSIARAQRLAMKRRASTALQQAVYDLPEGVTHLDVQHARLLKRLSKVFDIAGNYDTRVLFEKWMGFGAGTDLSSIPEVLKSATKPYFINIPKFETRGDYLSALHELGHQAFRHHVVGRRPFGGLMARRTSRWGKELGIDFTGGFLKAGPKSASAIFEEEAFAWHNALKNARMLDSDSARNYARLYLLSYHDSALLEHGVTPTLGPAGKFFFPGGRRAFAGRLPMRTALAVKRHEPLNMAQANVLTELNKELAKAGFVDFRAEMRKVIQRQRNIARRARGVNNLIKAVRESTPDIPQGMRGAVSRLGRAQGEETQAMRTALDFLNTPLTDAEKVTTKAPGVWYHGTRRVFNRFLKRNKFLDPNSLLYGPGHYFTDDPAIAAGYARGGFSYSFTDVKSLRKFMESKPNMYLQDVKRLRYSQKFGHVGTLYSMPGHMTFPKEGQSYIHAIFGDAPANVHMARLAVKNPFKIEAPVTQKTIDALKSTLRTQMQFRAGEPYKASKVMYGHRFSEFEMRDIEDMFKQAQQEQKIHHFNRHWFTNERLYHYLEQYSGSKAAVNKLLQRAGFDAIQHIGGKISGGKSHHVTIVFSGGQVRPGYWRGGEVPGMAGQAVDITAHAGETILTRTQKKQMGQNIVKSVSNIAKNTSWGGFSGDDTYNSVFHALRDIQPLRVTLDTRGLRDDINHIIRATAPKPQPTLHDGRPSTSRHRLGYEQPGSTNNYHYSPTINMKTSDDASATTQARHAEYALRQKWNDFHRGDR